MSLLWLLLIVILLEGPACSVVSSRKAFQKPMKQGVELLHAVQDVYLCKEITVA